MNQKHKTQQRKEYIPRKTIKALEVQPIFSERCLILHSLKRILHLGNKMLLQKSSTHWLYSRKDTTENNLVRLRARNLARIQWSIFTSLKKKWSLCTHIFTLLSVSLSTISLNPSLLLFPSCFLITQFYMRFNFKDYIRTLQKQG